MGRVCPSSCPCLRLLDPWIGVYWGLQSRGLEERPRAVHRHGSAQLLGPAVAVLLPVPEGRCWHGLSWGLELQAGMVGEQAAAGAGDVPGLGQPLTYFSPPTLQRPARRSSRSPPWPRGHFCWRHRRSTRYGLLPRSGSCLRRGGWGGSDANCCQRYPAVMGRGRSRRSLLGPGCQGEGSLGPRSQGCWGSQGCWASQGSP